MSVTNNKPNRRKMLVVYQKSVYSILITRNEREKSMIYTNMTKKAIRLIFQKHSNQVDKAGMPYVLHPLHVAENMKDEVRTTVALLHDIVEDTDMTFEDLEKLGFPQRVIGPLKLLTHNDGVNYFEYIRKVGTDPVAADVKIADLEHNSDLTRLNTVTENDLKRVEKYKKCLNELLLVKQRDYRQVAMID